MPEDTSETTSTATQIAIPSLHAACSRSSGIAAPSTVDTSAAAISSTRIGSFRDSKKSLRNDFEGTSLNLFAPNAARRASIEGVVATEAGTRAGPESAEVQRRAARPEGPPREERRALSLSCLRCFEFRGLRRSRLRSRLVNRPR